jgi:hypothetical protein
MNRATLRRSVLALGISLLAAACSGAPATPEPSAAPPPPSPLAAGTYTSTGFQPPVTYTVPAGWTNPEDRASYFLLQPAGTDITGIHFVRDAVAASQDQTCPATPEPGVGTTASELVAWIGERPGLTVSDPSPVTTGGLRGFVIDVGIVDGWLASCPFASGLPTVPLLVSSEPGFRWVVAGSERLRLYVLDVPAGGTVIVDVDAFDGSLFNELVIAASPIIASLEFGSG